MTEDRTIVERLRWFRDLTQNPLNFELMEVHYGLSNLVRELKEVKEDAAPDCAHCGSPFTYIRGSDGDIACYDCPGIMPRCSECGQPTTYCEECEQYHHRESFQQEHADAREVAE